jgi:NADH dehydrogenase
LALGNITNYFGIQGLPEYSYNIKTIEGAERFKAHLHSQLVEEKRPDVNYVIVGGGPTGVELAGALGSYLHRIVQLHHIAKLDYGIELVEVNPRLLPRLPESFSAKVQQRLEALGVKVITGEAVQGETASELMLKGEKISTKTVVWTAGMANNPCLRGWG